MFWLLARATAVLLERLRHQAVGHRGQACCGQIHELRATHLNGPTADLQSDFGAQLRNNWTCTADVDGSNNVTNVRAVLGCPFDKDPGPRPGHALSEMPSTDGDGLRGRRVSDDGTSAL